MQFVNLVENFIAMQGLGTRFGKSLQIVCWVKKHLQQLQTGRHLEIL